MSTQILNLPTKFSQTITEVFGERGREWLERLPTTLAECEQRWNLTLLPAFPNLSFNYVAPVIRADGSDAVLKAGVPHKELWTETAALRVYDGRGCARLLDADAVRGFLLLERLRPGTPLTTLADETNDAKATSIAASVMRQLWRPAPTEHAFLQCHDWAQGMERMRAHFDGGVGPFPKRLVEEAETLWTELLADAAPPVLLHGDLHHDNILAADRNTDSSRWLAIDPKGLVGEPAYEVGALLRNLWPERHALSDPDKMFERRVWQLAEELGFSRERVRGWAVAQSVLSAWWCIEDGGDSWQSAISAAEQLAAIKI